MKPQIVLLVVLLYMACAGTSTQVRDVSDLMPPQRVEVERDGDTMGVAWQPSPHQNRDDFAGYHVYIARRSLVMTPVGQLPAPVVVPRSQHSVTVDTLDPGARYFVHVRSRLQNGALSLPSLPEQIIEPGRPKNP